MPRLATSLAFLATSALGGAAWGTVVRAYWDRPGRFGQPTGALAGFASAFREWSDVWPIAVGMLAVAALYRRLLGPRFRLRLGWRVESGLVAVLILAAVVWGHPHLRGVARWEGVVVHVGTSRLCLLALQLSLGVAGRIGSEAAQQLVAFARDLPLYLIGRGAFVLAFMKALRLRGENAMYLVVPAGAAMVEAVLLVLAAVACLFVSRRARGRDAREIPP